MTSVRCRKHKVDCILTPTLGEHWLYLCPICDKERIKNLNSEIDEFRKRREISLRNSLLRKYSEEFTRAQYEGSVWWKERKRSIERDYILKSTIREILFSPTHWKGFENYDYHSSCLEKIQSLVEFDHLLIFSGGG